MAGAVCRRIHSVDGFKVMVSIPEKIPQVLTQVYKKEAE